MWFRIELHKDGSVASCTEVEGSIKDSKHVFYVEADSKTAALRLIAKNWREKHRRDQSIRNKARLNRLREQGRCFDCEDPAMPGHRRCETDMRRHRELTNARRAAKRDGTFKPRRRPDDVELYIKRLHKDRGRFRKLKSRGRDDNWTDDLNIPTLRKVLAKYDTLSPRAFRAWLEEKAGVPQAERVGAAAE